MFKKIVSTQGFWRSVISIGIAFALLFTIIKWAIEGFKMEYFISLENPLFFVLGLMVSGFVYGFLVTYGKYRGIYKKGKLK
jgi:hypothetical protein